MTEYMPFEAIVYDITKDESSYNIHSYVEYRKEIEYYTFQTRKKIPKIILRKYEKAKEEDYYPKVFIIPTPPRGMGKQPIRFDDNFALVVGYSKEIPPYVPLDKLIIASRIKIYGKIDKPQGMYVEGVCGLDFLNNNNSELRSYTINLGRANLEDLLMYIRYYSRNNQSNRNEEMKEIGWYIFIGKDQNLSCKQSNIAPRDIKILEIYM